MFSRSYATIYSSISFFPLLSFIFYLVFSPCFPGGCSKRHAPQPYVQLYLLHPPSAQPTDSTHKGTVERERVEVSGPISEDAVWECGKEYYVTGDVTVEAGATLRGSLSGTVDDPAGWGGEVCAGMCR